jgi:hypothetical protein
MEVPGNGVEKYLMVIAWVIMALRAIWRLYHATRSRRNGTLSHFLFQTEIVYGSATLLIFPLLVMYGTRLNHLAGLALCFLWIGVETWADERQKYPED